MKTVTVNLSERSYPVHVGPGSRATLSELCQSAPTPRQIVIIADETVAGLHLDTLLAALPAEPIVARVPAGESSKSVATAERLYDALAAARVERNDLILTFGGGVVGDLGGFAAATWLRGLRFVQIPTTLLAAIDASVGGKTGVNHPAGKNLVGAFHQPIGVVADTDFLATLPPRDFTAGLAESVKHALIRDADFLEWHETQADAICALDADVLTELIGRNVAIKANVVSQDEREHGLRAILNFGHTIGHAIEHVLHFDLRHGECVALGMVAANRIAVARGMIAAEVGERTVRLLERLGLPTRLTKPVDPAQIATTCRLDKKVRAGAVHFVLLSAIGQTQRVADVTDDEIADATSVLQRV